MNEIKLLSTKTQSEQWQSQNNDFNREKGVYFKNNAESFNSNYINSDEETEKDKDLGLSNYFSTGEFFPIHLFSYFSN